MDTTKTTRNLSVRTDSIVQNAMTQIRTKGVHSEVVKEYREAMRQGTELPPLTVVQVDPKDDERGFILIDGWHRLRAMRELERDYADVVVLPETDPNRYRWLAAKGNRSHGLRLTRADKREVFRAYIKAGEHRTGMIGRNKIKSARQMAKELQGIVGDKQLAVWMQKDFPSVYRLMSAEEGTEGMTEDEPFDMRKYRQAELAKEAVIKLKEFKALMRAIKSKELKEKIYGHAEVLLPGVIRKAEAAVKADLDADEEF